ncbi:MAG: hypothetical protein ACREJB_00715 [Planctomycetaceae bacterium]
MMAHVWQTGPNKDWSIAELSGEAYRLSPDGPAALSASDRAAEPAALVLRRVGGTGQEWALLAAADAQVRINGTVVALGVRALADRDEIVFADADGRPVRFFFSTEQRAGIEPFPGQETPLVCPRCKLEIAAGNPAVRCPACGAWHHQAERECWTYAETCCLCHCPTALDAGYRWTPEEL